MIALWIGLGAVAGAVCAVIAVVCGSHAMVNAARPPKGLPDWQHPEPRSSHP